MVFVARLHLLHWWSRGQCYHSSIKLSGAYGGILDQLPLHAFAFFHIASFSFTYIVIRLIVGVEHYFWYIGNTK